MNEPKFIDGPGPDSQPGPKFIDGPGPDSAASASWHPTNYGFKVRPTTTSNGKPSVEREDGAVWYGPGQGNTGTPGWFDAQGRRADDVPAPSATVGQSGFTLPRFKNDDEVIRYLGGDPAQLKREDLGYKPGEFLERINQYKSAANSQPARLLLRAGHAAGAPVVAADQLGDWFNKVFSGPEDQEKYDILNKLGDARRKARELSFQAYVKRPDDASLPVVGDPAAMAGTLTIPVPGGSAKTAAGKVLQGSAVGGALGFMTPTWTPELGGNPMEGKGAQTAMGAAGGGGMSLGLHLLGKAGNAGASALAGTKFGNAIGIPTEIKPEYAGAPELAQEMQAKGIRTSVGDVTGDPYLRGKEDSLARNNQAMMRWRLAQNQEASAYADQVMGKLKDAVKTQGWQNLSDVEAAAQGGGKRAGEAQMLLRAMQSAGDDWKEIVQQSGNLRLFLNKLTADRNFDQVRGIADAIGAGDVRPTATTKVLADMDAGLSRNVGSDEGLKSYVSKLRAGFQPGTAERRVMVGGSPGPLDMAASHPAIPAEGQGLGSAAPQATAGGPVARMLPESTPPQQDLSFDGLRQLRSEINNRIASAQSGQVVSPSEVPYLRRISQAIESDMQAYAKQDPRLWSAYKAANEHYQTQVAPYKEMAFGKALADTDPLRAANLFKGYNTSQQQRFYDLLDPRGQAALRAGLMQDALMSSEKTQRGVMGSTFSPAQVAGKLEELQRKGVMGVAFPGGPDAWAAQGLAKVLRTIDRSSNVGFTPPTGVTAESVGATVKQPSELLMKGANLLNGERLMKLYTDPQGRLLLQRAGDLTVGSPAMQKIIDQLAAIAPEASTVSKAMGATAASGASSSRLQKPSTTDQPQQ